jgi:hypothetical protein
VQSVVRFGLATIRQDWAVAPYSVFQSIVAPALINGPRAALGFQTRAIAESTTRFPRGSILDCSMIESVDPDEDA